MNEMCLDKITKKYKSSEYKRGFGWKIFNKSLYIKKPLYSRCQGNHQPLYRGTFLNEKNYRSVLYLPRKKIEAYPEDYKFGWHIYLKEPDLSSTIKVEYKGGHTRGIDNGDKVIVTKYMKILDN